METARVSEDRAAEPDEDAGVLGLARGPGSPSLSGSSHTARRQSRIEPTQPMPVNSSSGAGDEPDRAGVLDQAVDVELVGDAGDLLGDLVLEFLLPLARLSVAAPTAAATVSSGKSATKLMKVIAAASRVHFTRSRRSYDRHACVRISRATAGPMTGSFFSQSMIRLPCPVTSENPCPGTPETQDGGEGHTDPRTGDRVGASRGEPEAIVADGDAQELDEGAREVHGEEREEVGVRPGPPHGVVPVRAERVAGYATEQPATNDSALAVSGSRPTGPRSQRKRPRSAA